MKNILFMKKKIILLAAGFLILLTSCSPYCIDEGFDFATGESIQAKRTLENPKETIWIKRYPGYKRFYEKYKLVYPMPILIYLGGTEDTQYGKICWDGYSPYYRFFEILQRFNPPPEEAREIFAHCIAMYEKKADNKTVEAYLTERFNYYNDPLMKKND